MCIIEKNKESIAKIFKLIFSGTVFKIRIKCSRNNSMPKKCHILFKYENSRYIGWNNLLKTL